MDLLAQKILNSIVQIFIFSLIPLVWWCITARGEISFLQWIGVKRILEPKKSALWIAGTTLAYMVVSVFILYTVKNIETATSEFKDLRMKALPAILAYAVMNTSLPEELLFRGFLLKRLSRQFGFPIGNAVQSALFGLLHGAMFLRLTGVARAILIIGFTGGFAWCIGYVNEKKAGGSILPGWCMHAVANIFSGVCSAFALI